MILDPSDPRGRATHKDEEWKSGEAKGGMHDRKTTSKSVYKGGRRSTNAGANIRARTGRQTSQISFPPRVVVRTPYPKNPRLVSLPHSIHSLVPLPRTCVIRGITTNPSYFVLCFCRGSSDAPAGYSDRKNIR